MALRDQVEHTGSPLGNIIYSAGTDVGMRREENQDSYGIISGDRFRLHIVADGMGGVQGGAVASNLAISTIENLLKNRGDCSQVEFLKAAHAANEAIHIRGKDDPALAGMGTTLVALLFTPGAMFVAHVGDSRAYLIRSGEISQLTEDHTLVQELVRSGAITEEQAQHHPVSHMLTRSMGPSPQIEVDCELFPGGVKPKDMFLLCSDGLYNLVKPSEIADIVSTNSTDDAVQMLIDLANERGGTDNITVLIVSVGEGYTPTIQSDELEDDEMEDGEDYLITEDEPSPFISQTQQSSKRVGGYHETGEVADAPVEDESIEVDEELEQHVSQVKEETEIYGEESSALKEDVLEEADVEEELLEEEQGEGDTFEEYETTPHRSNRLPLIAGGFFGGILVAYLLFGGQPELPRSSTVVTVKQRGEPIIAQSAPEIVEATQPQVAPSSNLPVLNTIYSTPLGGLTEQDLAEVLGPTTQQQEIERIGPAEKSSIIKRKRDLETLVFDLNGKLGQFDRPLSGEIGEMLKASTKRAEEIRSKLDQIRSDIDVATRKLAVWYDRRRRLQTTDAINMASEVSVSVPVVKQKKEEFERATWDYLKEVEALRYSPGSREKEAHVSELVRIRATKMKELAAEVRSSIDRALSDADHGIAELTLQRSQLESSLDLIKGDMEFVRTITGSDSLRKQELKDDILRRRESAATELEELNKLLPEPQKAPSIQ